MAWRNAERCAERGGSKRYKVIVTSRGTLRRPGELKSRADWKASGWHRAKRCIVGHESLRYSPLLPSLSLQTPDSSPCSHTQPNSPVHCFAGRVEAGYLAVVGGGGGNGKKGTPSRVGGGLSGERWRRERQGDVQSESRKRRK
jgi:hypothetical protein